MAALFKGEIYAVAEPNRAPKLSLMVRRFQQHWHLRAHSDRTLGCETLSNCSETAVGIFQWPINDQLGFGNLNVGAICTENG